MDTGDSGIGRAGVDAGSSSAVDGGAQVASQAKVVDEVFPAVEASVDATGTGVAVAGGAPDDALRGPSPRQEVAEPASGAEEGERRPCSVCPALQLGLPWLDVGVV